MRVTVAARVAQDLASRIQARAERQQANVRAVNRSAAPQMVERVQGIVPRDTGYMADHTDFLMTNDSLGFEVGWWSRDFIGQTNPVNGTVIRDFYPVFVTLGTRFMAGRDALTPSLDSGWPDLRSQYIQALNDA